MIMFLFYASIEYVTVVLLLQDFDRYSLGLSWENWWLLQNLIAVILSFIGIIVGLQQGNYWWNLSYEKSKSKKCRWFSRK